MNDLISVDSLGIFLDKVSGILYELLSEKQVNLDDYTDEWGSERSYVFFEGLDELRELERLRDEIISSMSDEEFKQFCEEQDNMREIMLRLDMVA